MEGDISTASNDGFYNPKVKKYPLSLVTPVSVYRQHSSNDNNPFMREDVYRHAVWISGVDAKAAASRTATSAACTAIGARRC